MNEFKQQQQQLSGLKVQVCVTFEQQRHEGDVRRAEFGHSQSVGPVVPRGILRGAKIQHYSG